MKRFLLILVCFLPALGYATTCSSYTNTYQLQVAAVSSTSSNQTNFPVLFVGNSALASTGSGGFSQSSGVDVVFCTAATGGTILPYELVTGTYNASTGAGEWWIQFPTVSYNTAESVYAMVGAAGATNYSSPATLWSPYLGVWHFGTSATLTLTDSTGNNTATNHSATAGAGEINGGATFNGSSGYIDVGGTLNPPTPANGLSISAWGSVTSVSAVNLIASNDSNNSGFDFYTYSSGISMQIAGAGVTTSAARCTSCGVTSTGTYYHLAGVWNGSNPKVQSSWQLFVNGASKTPTIVTNSVASYTNASVDMAIGRQQVPANYYGGSLDEVRVSNQTLSADWIKTEYLNQSAPTSFYTFTASTPTCSAPSFTSPAPGSYGSTQTPTITSSNCSSICYSLTTTPVVAVGVCTVGTSISSGSTVSISSTSTLSALAYQTSYNTSGLTTGTYTIGAVTSRARVTTVW